MYRWESGFIRTLDHVISLEKHPSESLHHHFLLVGKLVVELTKKLKKYDPRIMILSASPGANKKYWKPPPTLGV